MLKILIIIIAVIVTKTSNILDIFCEPGANLSDENALSFIILRL